VAPLEHGHGYHCSVAHDDAPPDERDEENQGQGQSLPLCQLRSPLHR
jgi:hypothetical protein